MHHVVGIMPFLFNCFFFPNLQFLVGGGILIELANPFLNWRTAIDLWENHNTAIAAKVQVINYMFFNLASSLVTRHSLRSIIQQYEFSILELRRQTTVMVCNHTDVTCISRPPSPPFTQTHPNETKCTLSLTM